MYYNVRMTPPTRVVSIDTYKRRIKEIVYGQLKNLFNPMKLRSWYFWLFAIFFIPCSLIYLCCCLAEIVVDTIFLPLALIPYVRFISLTAQVIIWSLGIAIGCFTCTDLTYSIDSTNLTASEKRVAENFRRSQELKNQEIEYLMPDDEQ
ncbi:MAG: hypothetical protein E7354_03205 [Clostridiales bacterium]|nr:hypothetical protein [Clostridiales bacterium]